jgi:protein-S-isoprenylcysteine O-methyltransferase Ste14
MRIPIVSLNLWLLWRELFFLRTFVVNHPYLDGDWSFLAGLLARVGVIVFLGLLIVFHASRRRPVRKYETWTPKLIAALGMGLSYVLLLFPRAGPHYGFDLAASIFLIVGNYLSLVSVTTLGRSLSIMPEVRKLVTGGLYARIRHPLYLAELVALMGVFLQYRSIWAFGILFLVVFFQLKRMNWEELILAEAFPEYEAYRRRSWRLVPGIY